MERWSAEHRVFLVETFFKNNDSVIVRQRAFRRHFNINRNDSVPSRNTILLWIKNIWETACAVKKRPPGKVRTVRTLENIARVRDAVISHRGEVRWPPRSPDLSCVITFFGGTLRVGCTKTVQGQRRI